MQVGVRNFHNKLNEVQAHSSNKSSGSSLVYSKAQNELSPKKVETKCNIALLNNHHASGFF